jgi:hypothetical protein
MVALALLDAPAARAQIVHGSVVDERGAPVIRAEVQVLPSGRPAFTDAKGNFELGSVAPGEHLIRVRRVGFDATVDTVVTALDGRSLVIVLRHAAFMLDTVHTIELEQRLPRLFERRRQHLGASLYGAALDSTFARGGSRSLVDMLTIDRHMAALMRRPNCLPGVAFVDGIQVYGNLQPSDSSKKMRVFGQPAPSLGRRPSPAMPAQIEMYISQKDIAAIEVFDSPDFVHEPFLDPGDFPTGTCQPIVLIWSKYYRQPHWAGH